MSSRPILMHPLDKRERAIPVQVTAPSQPSFNSADFIFIYGSECVLRFKCFTPFARLPHLLIEHHFRLPDLSVKMNRHVGFPHRLKYFICPSLISRKTSAVTREQSRSTGLPTGTCTTRPRVDAT